MPRQAAAAPRTTYNDELVAPLTVAAVATTEGRRGDDKAMQVFVKAATGRTIVVYVKGADDVSRVRAIIQEREGIPHSQQILYSTRGQLLEDGQTLNDCGVRAESNLQLRLVGDVPPAAERRSRWRYGTTAAIAAVVVLCVMVVVGRSQSTGPSPQQPQPPSPCDASPCGAYGKCVAQGGNYTCGTPSWRLFGMSHGEILDYNRAIYTHPPGQGPVANIRAADELYYDVRSSTTFVEVGWQTPTVVDRVTLKISGGFEAGFQLSFDGNAYGKRNLGRLQGVVTVVNISLSTPVKSMKLQGSGSNWAKIEHLFVDSKPSTINEASALATVNN
jgi:hypothetical protein